MKATIFIAMQLTRYGNKCRSSGSLSENIQSANTENLLFGAKKYEAMQSTYGKFDAKISKFLLA